MNVRNYRFIAILLLLANLSYAVEDYYAFLNLSPSANNSAIRAKCGGIDKIREKKSELEGARVQKLPKGKIAALEQEIARLVRVGRLPDAVLKAAPPELKTACEILRDPGKRAKYNAELGEQKKEEEKKKREEEEKLRRLREGIEGADVKGTYYAELQLPETASAQDIKKRCETQKSALIDVANKKKIERGQAKNANRKAQLDKEVKALEVKIANTNLVCGVLKDSKQKKEYDKQLADKKRKEQKPPSYTLGTGIKGTYYEELQLPETATAKEIEIRCLYQNSLLVDIAKKQRIKRDSAVGDERKKLELEVKELEQKIADTKVVCGVLQDPKQKKEYDRQLAESKKKKKGAGIFANIKDAINSAKKDADVLLINLLGDVLGKIPIPDAAGKVFNKSVAMRNMKIIKGPSGVRTGLGFTGTMSFNKFAVQATVYVMEDQAKKMQYSLIMELPEHYKISSMFPSFKKLDKLSLPKGSFVLSTTSYSAPAGFSVKPGFNFIATLDLTGPLSILNRIKDQAKKLKSVIVRSEPIFFRGVIPRDIKKVEFSATIPMHIGIDFTKIAKMPKSIKNIFKEITTDDFVFAVTAPQLKFTVEGGVRIVLATQRDPIRLSMFGIIEPASVSLGMRMRNMLELKWFALGNAGIQLDFDEALLPVAAVFGIPFTGIGLNGQVDIGKAGEARAILNLAAGVRVASTHIPDIVFDAEAKNIRFANIINLASKIAVKTKIAKREIPVGNLPTINIERLRGYLSLEDTRIAQKEYPAGFALEVDTLIMKKRAGFSIDFRHTAGTVSGDGYVSNLDVTIKGKKIFTLTGPPFTTKAGKTVEGPHIIFDFDVKHPTKGMFGVDGIFEVPAVGLTQKTHFLWRGLSMEAAFETVYAGFAVLFEANINLGEKDVKKKWQEMRLKFGFKGDFAKFLSEQAKPAIDSLKTEASDKLERLNAEIKHLSNKIETLGKESVDKEITRVKGKIKDLEAKVALLEKTLAKEKERREKRKIRRAIRKAKIDIGLKKTYLNALLKPGGKVVKGVSKAVAAATKTLSNAKLLKKGVEKTLGGFSKMVGALAKGAQIFQIKEAIGEFNADEAAAGKLPKLVSFVAEVNVPGVPKVKVNLSNVQFNLKKPKDSVKDLAMALVKGIKFSK